MNNAGSGDPHPGKEIRCSVVEMRLRFAEFVNRVAYGKERIVLEKHGKPVVVLVPYEEAPHSAKAAGRGKPQKG